MQNAKKEKLRMVKYSLTHRLRDTRAAMLEYGDVQNRYVDLSAQYRQMRSLITNSIGLRGCLTETTEYVESKCENGARIVTPMIKIGYCDKFFPLLMDKKCQNDNCIYHKCNNRFFDVRAALIDVKTRRDSFWANKNRRVR